MTVKELREQLEGYADDEEVMFAYGYGDRSNTQVASKIRSVEYNVVEMSSYHRQWAVQGDTPDEHLDEDEVKEIVLIEG